MFCIECNSIENYYAPDFDFWRESCLLRGNRFFSIFTTMKLLLSTVLAFLSLIISEQTDITPQVADALKRGDAGAIASYCMNPVELEIAGEEGAYAPADARTIIGKFFAANAVKGFSIKHQGTSKLDDQYRIGDLVTAKGTFRVTFFMKKSGNTWQIKQLKIESN